jgi:TRAP-type uncharacterized transport system substrate-binding protein
MMDADFRSKRTRLRRVWLAFACASILVVLFLTLVVIKPAMPDRVVLLTGPETSAYHEFGVRLAKDLQTRGLHAEVVVTGGSFDNLRRLTEGENVVALAPSVVDWQGKFGDSPPLVALGSVAIEPLWLFYRSDLEIDRISDLAGKTVATEGEYTTSYQVANLLIDQTGLADRLDLVPLTNQTATRSLRGFTSGAIDAVFLSGQPNSTVVQSLLKFDRASLLSFDRGKACAMRVSGATVIVAPEGVFDLARDSPPQDTQLLASATCLVSHEDIHPAVVPMLLAGVENVRQESSSFISSDRFPSSNHVTLPLAPAAQRYFRQGEVGLSKFFPYQAVRFLNHLGFFVVPLLTVAVVLLKAVPTGLRILGGLRIKRWLKRLEAVEKAWAAGVDSQTLLADLDRIDRGTATMFVPRSIVHDYIDFRQFLHDMRERVRVQDPAGRSLD